MKQRLTIYLKNGKAFEATLQGIDMPKSKVITWPPGTIVIKVPGHKYWANLPPGPTYRYSPGEYQVYKIEGEGKSYSHYKELIVSLIVTIPLRS